MMTSLLKRFTPFFIVGVIVSNAAHSNATAPHLKALVQLNHIYALLCPQRCGHVTIQKSRHINSASNAYHGAPHPKGTSIISYNPDFMNYISLKYGASVGYATIAHELGHHIEFYFGRHNISPWEKELAADYWAGCALAKSGYSLLPTLKAYKEHSAHAGTTHPDWKKRHPALFKGYKACGSSSIIDNLYYPYGR